MVPQGGEGGHMRAHTCKHAFSRTHSFGGPHPQLADEQDPSPFPFLRGRGAQVLSLASSELDDRRHRFGRACYRGGARGEAGQVCQGARGVNLAHRFILCNVATDLPI